MYILKQLFFSISVNSGFGDIFSHYSSQFQRIIVNNHNSFTYKFSHLWNQLLSYIKRSTELSEYRKHLRSFNLTILRASCKCNFCISYGFTISVFFFP